MIGCSSFTIETEDNKHLLSRTMDFMIEMAEQVVFVPRDKNFITSYSCQDEIEVKYAFLGMGEVSNNSPILFDGVNEQGLTGATLYFPGFAVYHAEQRAGKINVSPDKVIPVVLALAKDLDAVAHLFANKLQIMNDSNPTLNTVPPLHFIFSDTTGKSLIIEPGEEGVTIIEDSIGVMTNSPDYHWHETNLRNYLSVSPNQHQPVAFLNKTLRPFSQGSGTFGLPGDFTPPSRFVRTAFLKNNAFKPKNEVEAVSLSHHILESVSIPKGIVITESQHSDYTCYSAYICSESQSYYFSTYGNQRISKITLTDELKNSKDYQQFKVSNEEDICALN
ncbi:MULTISPECIES: choloylglycine hydrolase family protein [unclassified Enterococcus]|uniref:choloylglycine hydrolase family protein n=1 Tax=unclassified Enterococcus TaxID=2608891 RepID=UPI001552446C|nr:MULTISPECIES: choloylglycine hydrolase family protein [unclassified Enterococcus]MBS7576483.1 choloylglycine hydrolase family protein [Enterococcus sp. MMGLQ5-2]MBS7583715.1 choloylglycine hydrolase family protein [Enterococcus sp. MMGLQ5-1]NPD11576.1 choloylglycine hydrolase family protein [Enterococcus sp. MMGLQ5-1]NPD36320.1 choloylglycine hydrolase family protein [Enterococcus sp. MMGLQ5-2]